MASGVGALVGQKDKKGHTSWIGVARSAAEEQQTDFANAIHSCLSHYSWLAAESVKQGRVRYNLVHKHHSLAHMADQGRTINPTVLATYMEESMVGQGARIYNSNAYAGRAQHVVLSKYLLALQLKLSSCVQ